MEPIPPLNREVIRKLLEAFDLHRLFIEELGWDHGGADTAAVVGETTFPLKAIAQKRGFVAYQCVADGGLPSYATRQKIEREVAKAAHEHLIVFAPENHSTLSWLWVKREMGQPARPRQVTYSRGQTAEDLTQRLERLRFTLAEEEKGLSINDPTRRATEAFDVEKVTKRFYDRFRTEHQAFLGFIKGIRDVANREWYASLMLSRTMFIYFIQRLGFLDNDPDYLRNRLATGRQDQGSGKFHSFYHVFLLRLFHEGLSKPEATRDPGLTELLGRVPYLNGGLFDVHNLERDNPNIDIPDKAFEQIFHFLDAYQWRLDDRPLRNDNEINPDVLGYIFEKYVNQKQMGAYYTQEDITGYISRNTIVPRLFDQAKRDCAIAFKPGGGVWRLLVENPDRYFYPSVRHGITFDMASGTELGKPRPLPREIAAGLKNVGKRGEWNSAAPPEYALPTETWREHVARRQRYEEVRGKLASGEVCSINDLITYNLDIERFAEDAIRTSEGPELVRAFWKAIRNVTVLDPTVGSGAFLFAALNVLEPLYDACLDAMRELVADLEHSRRQQRPDKLADFRKVLDEIRQHPSARYFVLKSIVVNNLYGVDIMEEAVEICKLRLFLKLVAQLERYEQIEPLPDIDFNVKSGNTLVGFTSMQEVEDTLRNDVVSLGSLPAIEESAKDADRAFRQFQAMQTERHLDATSFTESKQRYAIARDELRKTLDRFLAKDFGVRHSRDGIVNQTALRKWQRSHQPFHWLVEFYGTMARGGFDVVIGNPPYVESGAVKEYTIRGYKTAACGNLYTLVVERNAQLLGSASRTGMIIPHSATCTDRMGSFARFLAGCGNLWTSTFDIRPSKLFDGADQRLLIYIQESDGNSNEDAGLFSSCYNRWHGDFRASLLQQLRYTDARTMVENSISKIGDDIEHEILRKLSQHRSLEHCVSGNASLYYHNSPRYWIRAMDFTPYFWNDRDGKKLSTQVMPIACKRKDLGVVVSVLNSSLFYWWFLAWSDSRHLNRREIDKFPLGLDAMDSDTRQRLASLAKELMANFRQHSRRKETKYATTGKVVYDEFYQRPSKPILDKIDRALVPHYGLSEEEVDFIINYSIKFRLGVDS